MSALAFALLFPTGAIKILKEEEKNRTVIAHVQGLFHDSFRESLLSVWLLAKVHLLMGAIVEPLENAGAYLRDVVGICDVIVEENGGPDIFVAMMRLLAEELLNKIAGDLAEETEEQNPHYAGVGVGRDIGQEVG